MTRHLFLPCLLLLLALCACQRPAEPTVPAAVSEDDARRNVARFAVGNHAWDIRMPAEGRVVRNGVLLYAAVISGLGDGTVLRYFVDSSSGDVLREDFSVAITGPAIRAEIQRDAQVSQATPVPELEPFVMGMWKFVDLYSTEDGAGKGYGTPLERWTLLGASDKKYPMNQVLCLGNSPEWANRLKVQLGDDKVAWVDAPQVWLSSQIARKDDAKLGIEEIVGKNISFGTDVMVLDFVVEPLGYESEEKHGNISMAATPVFIDSKGVPYPLYVDRSLIQEELDYDIKGFGLFHRTVMDTLVVTLRPGLLSLQLVSADGLNGDPDNPDDVLLTWKVEDHTFSTGDPATILTTKVHRQIGCSESGGGQLFTVYSISQSSAGSTPNGGPDGGK